MKQGMFIPNGFGWCKAFLIAGGVLSAPIPALADLGGQFPQLTTVTGVKAGDTLNVRAQPSAKATDIGDLQPQSRVEVLELDASGKWARIVHEEGSGWISSGFLSGTPYAMTKTGVPLGLSCFGTEPFWSVKTQASGSATFEMAGGPVQISTITWSGQSRNTAGSAYGLVTQGFNAVMSRAECSDGMSDRTYGWAIDVLVGGKNEPALLSGCCSADLN